MSETRIGVYVCECGINISATVDVQAVAEKVSTVPGVVVARVYKYMCAKPGQQMIQEDIRSLGLNRIVVAACSPRMHETTFQQALAEAGLNPYYLQMANIREHVSWMTDDRRLATEKAKRLVRAAVFRVGHQAALEPRRAAVRKAALVVGGGVAGIQAALSIAEAGYPVYLVERQPSIGGRMAQLDKTFPTLDCSLCILGPKMVEVGRHPKITLLTYSEVENLSGFVGNFQVRVRKRARSVDEQKCTGCGLCQEKCPTTVLDTAYEAGMGRRKAIYRPFAQAIPNIPVIDREHCHFFTKGRCRVCQKVCPTGAVDFEQQDQFLDLDVGAIVVAAGYSLWDPRQLAQYSYGLSPNILTGLQLERLISAGGPTGGQIVTSEGRTPQRVAILHCVGSRDVHAKPYCSRICCMYALKHAHQIREKTGAEVYEFYIDMRAFGKGYEEFYERVQQEGVIFVRGRGAEVQVQPDGRLRVQGEDANLGRLVCVDVDMVILASAMEPPADTDRLAGLFRLGRTPDGWLAEAHPKLRPSETATAGIFLAGCCQGPRDIPDTVSHADAAAMHVVRLFNQGEIAIAPTVAQVEEEKCVGCGECVLACPYSAISRNLRGKAEVNPALCQGCGTCAAACPSHAIHSLHFTDEQMVAQIDGLLEEFVSYSSSQNQGTPK